MHRFANLSIKHELKGLDAEVQDRDFNQIGHAVSVLMTESPSV
jgi:hypothetical protein